MLQNILIVGYSSAHATGLVMHTQRRRFDALRRRGGQQTQSLGNKIQRFHAKGIPKSDLRKNVRQIPGRATMMTSSGALVKQLVKLVQMFLDYRHLTS